MEGQNQRWMGLSIDGDEDFVVVSILASVTAYVVKRFVQNHPLVIWILSDALKGYIINFCSWKVM
jgi:hypothetical protein